MLERLATKLCTSLKTSWVFSSLHTQLHHIHIDIEKLYNTSNVRD